MEFYPFSLQNKCIFYVQLWEKYKYSKYEITVRKQKHQSPCSDQYTLCTYIEISHHYKKSVQLLHIDQKFMLKEMEMRYQFTLLNILN